MATLLGCNRHQGLKAVNQPRGMHDKTQNPSWLGIHCHTSAMVFALQRHMNQRWLVCSTEAVPLLAHSTPGPAKPRLCAEGLPHEGRSTGALLPAPDHSRRSVSYRTRAALSYSRPASTSQWRKLCSIYYWCNCGCVYRAALLAVEEERDVPQFSAIGGCSPAAVQMLLCY